MQKSNRDFSIEYKDGFVIDDGWCKDIAMGWMREYSSHYVNLDNFVPKLMNVIDECGNIEESHGTIQCNKCDHINSKTIIRIQHYIFPTSMLHKIGAHGYAPRNDFINLIEKYHQRYCQKSSTNTTE